MSPSPSTSSSPRATPTRWSRRCRSLSTSCAPSAWRSGRRDGSAPTNCSPAGPAATAPTRGSSGWSCARPITTTCSVSAATGWCCSIAAAGGSPTKPPSGPASESDRTSSPTSSPSSATAPTASRECPAGGCARRPPCSQCTTASTRSRRTPSGGHVPVRAAQRLAATLSLRRREALHARDLLVFRDDAPIRDDVDDLEWRGADRVAVEDLGRRLADDTVVRRVSRWRGGTAPPAR